MSSKASAPIPLPIGREVQVRLGDSFLQSSSLSYHKVQYDFKPASFSSRRPGSVEVGSDRSVTMKFTTPQSEYRGSTQLTTKDCVMIIEPDGSIVLERIWSNVRVKRARGAAVKGGPGDNSKSSLLDGDENDFMPPAKRPVPAHDAAPLADDEESDDDCDFVTGNESPMSQPRVPAAVAMSSLASQSIRVPTMAQPQQQLSSSGSSSDSSSSGSDSDSDNSSSSSSNSGGDSSDDDSSSSDDSDDLAGQLDQKIDQSYMSSASAQSAMPPPPALNRQTSGNLSSDLEMSDTDDSDGD
ncbi:ELL-associated factor 1-like [Sycon ciliatum]|uniref:ELL-associated factor 1-like n=1 Tax=Sycon ciliatum TaxID=27933 RepID=UPI0020A93558|eukprot:scpid75372/ scgid26114/ Ell-associated factor Eaf